MCKRADNDKDSQERKRADPGPPSEDLRSSVNKSVQHPYITNQGLSGPRAKECGPPRQPQEDRSDPPGSDE